MTPSDLDTIRASEGQIGPPDEPPMWGRVRLVLIGVAIFLAGADVAGVVCLWMMAGRW